MRILMCPRTEITIAGTQGVLKCNGEFRLACLGSNCAAYPCDAVDKFVEGCEENLIKQGEKIRQTIVGEPMTLSAFGQLLRDMYQKDEHGVPRWKKVFGVVKDGSDKPE